MSKTDLTAVSLSLGKCCLMGFVSIILLAGIGLTWANEVTPATGSTSPLGLKKLASAGKRVGWAALKGVATADYRAYDLEDLLPLEQVYLPKIALPAERHPSLLFSEDQKDLIRQRISREPYARWWQHILQNANSSLVTNLSDPHLEESKRAVAAKSCAFAYLVTRELSYLEKAREGLLHISAPPAVTTPEGGKTGVGWGDWVRASSLMLIYCVAYDLVAEDLSPTDRLLVAEKIAAETDQLYRNLKFAPPNNHKILMAAAVGTAALTLSSYGQGEAQAWLDAAMTNLRSGLAQIDEDGSYREGFYYAGYIARVLFPFILYLDRTTGHNLFRHRRLESLVQWIIRAGKPDGSIPLFDDAWQESRIYLPILVGQSQLGGVARWIYERERRVASGLLREVEFICAFDDRVLPEPPPWERTAFFPDGGMVVFGDGWASDGIYLLLLGEGEKALASGHEHLDPGHFILQAYGQDMLIDAAAGPRGASSDGRSWYLSSEGHNMLLVDGKGPSGNPFSGDPSGGQLLHCFRTPQISGAAVRTRYRGTEIQRTVHFLGHRYFLIFDQLSSPDAHEYELALHGLGEAFMQGPEKVSWSTAPTRLEVDFLSPEKDPLDISLRTGQHSPIWKQKKSHTYIRAKKTRCREAQFVTLLLPQGGERCQLKSADIPVASSSRAQVREISGEAMSGARHLVIAAEGGMTTAEGVTTDALICVTGFGADGAKQFFINGQGTLYAHLSDTCYISDSPITVSMVTEGSRWSGYVDAGEREVTILLDIGFDPGHVRFGQFPLEYEYRHGKVKLHLAGSGPLELGDGPPQVFTPQGSRDHYPFLEQLAWQDAPMARWEELSPEGQFLAQIQAMDVAREQVNGPLRKLSQRLGLGPDGLDRALGLTTGLAHKAYDPHNWARLNVPEHLEGTSTWGGVELYYYQDGYLTEEGLRLERLEGQLDTKGRTSVKVGHYSPYPEVKYERLSLNLGTISLATSLERIQDQRRHQFSAFHRPGGMVWGVQGYTHKGSDVYGIDLLLRGPSLTAEASQYRGAGESPGRRVLLSHRGRIFSPQAEFVDPGSAGGKNFRVSWASTPLSDFTWDFSSLLVHRSGQTKVLELSNTVSGLGENLGGQWYSVYQNSHGIRGSGKLHWKGDSARLTLGIAYDEQRRPLITQEVLSLQRDWGWWISTATSVSHEHSAPEGRDRVRMALSAHLMPTGTTRIHLRLEGNSRESRRVTWGLAMDRWGSISWGGGWHRLWTPLGERYSQVSAHASWRTSTGRGIRGRAEVQLISKDRVESYEIEIQQLGHPCSPGLLLSKDPLMGIRNDGFLKFLF